MDYQELATLADRILERSEDDDERVAEVLDSIDPMTRRDLILSDFFNAYQIFFFFFRITLPEIVKERLILIPASELGAGVLVDKLDLYEIIFIVRNGVPLVGVSDGERLIATFTGQESYLQARKYIEEYL